MSFWTEEKIASLKTLWADGFTATETGKKLGCSRNSVLSKIHRLGLSNTRQGGTPHAEVRRKFLDRENQRRRNQRSEIKPTAPVRFNAHPSGPSEPAAPVAIPEIEIEVRSEFPKVEGLPRALLDRNPAQCGFPVGDPCSPGFHYCTGRKHELSLYCAAHFKLTHQPLAIRQSVHRRVEKQSRSA